MQPTNDLDRLALQHGSDKFGEHFYTQHYERFFAPMRQKPVELLEIGVGGGHDLYAGGASLRMWRDYFPQGRIYGLDYHRKIGIDDDRIRTFDGDQVDPVALAALVNASESRQFDIIIDDGSHRSEHVIATFMMMFKYVKPGGFYVVEDTQTSYWPDYGGSTFDRNAPLSMMAFFKQFVDGINFRETHQPGYSPTEYDRTIVGMYFMHNIIFIEKGANDEPSTFVHGNRVPSAQ